MASAPTTPPRPDAASIRGCGGHACNTSRQSPTSSVRTEPSGFRVGRHTNDGGGECNLSLATIRLAISVSRATKRKPTSHGDERPHNDSRRFRGTVGKHDDADSARLRYSSTSLNARNTMLRFVELAVLLEVEPPPNEEGFCTHSLSFGVTSSRNKLGWTSRSCRRNQT